MRQNVTRVIDEIGKQGEAVNFFGAVKHGFF